MEKKVWLITGANRGLGRAFAEEALSHGDCVIAAARRPDLTDPFYAHENVFCVKMEVTDPEEVKEGVRLGAEHFGRIDVLINNAGFGFNAAMEEISDEELRKIVETDYFGVISVTKAVLPYMRAQKSGTILNLSSLAGMRGAAGSSAYNAVKFAIVGLSEALNQELSYWNIRVAALCPGPFRTDFRDPSSKMSAANPMQEYDGTPAHESMIQLRAGNHKQPGDPKKAAAFVYDMVQKPNLPVHILVGKMCLELVTANLKKTLEEIESYYEEAVATDYDE